MRLDEAEMAGGRKNIACDDARATDGEAHIVGGYPNIANGVAQIAGGLAHIPGEFTVIPQARQHGRDPAEASGEHYNSPNRGLGSPSIRRTNPHGGDVTELSFD